MTNEPMTSRWVKSSYSGTGSACVEWAPHLASTTGMVPVRDSKTVSGQSIAVPAGAFAAFVDGVKSGSLHR